MKRMMNFALALVALATFANQAAAQPRIPFMDVTSDAFEDGGEIPIRFTSHGENVQPGFEFTEVPDNAESMAVIFHDIDVALMGGTNDVLHWTAWNLPTDSIPQGELPEGAVQGANITGQNMYMGPGAPSPDKQHHYVWEFYALDTELDLEAGASREELLEAIDGHVVAKAAYVGLYSNASER